MGFFMLAEANQSLVEIAPWTMIAQICNLFIQIFLFKKFLFNPVKKIVTQRQEQVNGVYGEAAKAEAEAKASKEEYQALLANAKNEAAEMLRSATASAQSRSESIIREAKDEAAAIRAKANTDIELQKKKALNDIKDDISGIALSIAAKVVQKEINEKDQEAIIGEFIEKMGE